MASKKKKNDRRAFKKTGEELQQYLRFMRRGTARKAVKPITAKR